MKKTVSILLALALCCMLIPAVAESESPVGIWYINRAESEGIEVQIVDPAAITLTINEDGTYSLNIVGTAHTEGTWSLDGVNLTLTAATEGDGESDDLPTEYQFSDGFISMMSDETTIRLSTTPTEDLLVLPDIVPAETPEAFDGRWIPCAHVSSGMYAELDEESVKESGVLVIENGKAAIQHESDTGETVEDNSYDFTLAEGVLSSEDTEYYPTDLTIVLLEDGRLLYEAVMHLDEENDLIYSVLYNREAAAEEPAA